MQQRVDLNCDLGETDLSPNLDRDGEILRYVSSINIACGVHAGNEKIMRALIRMAGPRKIAIGAHPSYPDRSNFGRQSMEMSSHDLTKLLVEQIGALRTIGVEEGFPVGYVKPHGALYNAACDDRAIAQTIALAVREIDPGLRLMGLSGSFLLEEGNRLGLTTISEVFADRQYHRDGQLVSRSKPNAVLHDGDEIIHRLLKMLEHQTVRSIEGDEVSIQPDSICIHSDTPGALAIAKQINESLRKHGIEVGAQAGSLFHS